MSSAGMTLYVVHTSRPPEIAADCVAAARWASAGTSSVLLVTDVNRAGDYAACGADAVYESSISAESPVADFRFLDGLSFLLRGGQQFERVVCFRDDATFLGRAVDAAIGEILRRESCDLLAVADRNYYGDHFLRVGAYLSRWRAPHEIWDRPPAIRTAQSAVFAMTGKLARDLFHRRLLAPPGCTEWPVSVGAYLTWMCQLLRMTPYLRGSMDRPHAPFYVNDGWGGAYNPPPYILHSSALVYWSLRRVAAYTETETRAWCRSLRQANQ